MPALTLTERSIRSLPAPERGRIEYRDDVVPGLILRVTAQGARTWSVWYRVDGLPRRLTLGRASFVTLAAARQRAREVIADTGRGVDAVAERAARKAEEQARRVLGDTFDDLADRFLRAAATTLRPRTLAEYRGALGRDVRPVIGPLRPEDVTRGHVREIVDEVARRAPIQANRTFGALRRCFSWAVQRDMLPMSPCTGLRAPSPERVRERIYSNAELRAIVAAVESTRLGDMVGLLLRTGTRSEETRAARWADFDLEERLWIIPGGTTKNRESHPVPLSTGAVEILRRARIGQPEGCPWVFPSEREPATFMPVQGRSIRSIRRRSGVADFRLHDVRRTVATRLAEANTPVSVIEAVLGHRPPKLVRTYQKHGYVPEMRAALEAWNARLMHILANTEEGAEVVPIRVA